MSGPVEDPLEDETDQREATAAAYGRIKLTDLELWLRYFALGGAAGRVEVEAYLHELMPLPPLQRDLLSHAINERLDELAPPTAPYSSSWRTGSRPASLAALVELLDGAHLAPPEQLPALAAAAGRALGVRICLYLVDYEQRLLVPLPGAESDGRTPLGVDSTLAGRAFRYAQVVTSNGAAEPRLWVPLLDGVERLGVLEVVLADPIELHDPVLREQCRWVSVLLGHLVTAAGTIGDAVDSARRRQPRTPAAELIWALLPPLTVGVDGFVLAGMLEPCYEVGGDVFDYALSATSVTVAIFDGMGHGLDAGLLATAALAAYRSARRSGRGLPAQAHAIDQIIADQFGPDAFLTGVLAELDLLTGRLRYLAAGHPYPLLLRAGRVVKTLTAGRRLPFGLAMDEPAVGEETLQRGDWLVLHTDGVTEARGVSGGFFGQERLVDFLEREAAAAHPPPETVRRLVHALLDYQGGVLQDDAAIVLARWDSDTTGVSAYSGRF